MSIRWLTICLVLTGFILVDSNELSNDVSEEETQKIPRVQERVDCRHNKDASAPSEKKDYQHLIEALSKIAKVRVAEEASATAKVNSTLNDRIGASYQENDAKNDERSKWLTTKLPSELIYNVYFNSTLNGFKQQKFHCQASQAIYIPDIQENVPAYKCKFGNKTFVISSKRFSEDRRDSFHVNIDGNMLRKLYNPKSSRSRFNIIPAALALKPGHENYDIRD